MKNNNTIYVRMSIICTIVMTVALLGAGMVEEMTARLAISGGAAVLVWGTYLTLSMKQKHDFSERAMAVLAKAGLMCKRKEDGIVVKQGDVVMKAKLWEGTHGMKRVHFMFDFAPNIIDSVLPEGWALLAAECNANYDHTMVKQFDKVHDRFLCIDNTVYHIGASLKDLGRKWLGYTPRFLRSA